MLQKLRAVVTGGAGFVGSRLTGELLKRNCEVTVIDDFSSGRVENLGHLVNNRFLTVVKEDLRRPVGLERAVVGRDLVFHLAANPEVRVGQTSPRVHFEENVVATFNLLEALRHCEGRMVVVFASTSTVYGEASVVPTPEDYGPMVPISMYGASKLACEALLASYAYTFGFRALVLRLANIVGPGSNHGVIVDFIKKIRANSKELEILGDGRQDKSYMYFTDLVGAMVHLTEVFLGKSDETDVFNVGSKDKVSVKEIAEVVARELGCPKIRFKFTGGVDGGRGWKGDVKLMQLSIKKLLDSGWKPQYSSRQAVRLAAKELSRELSGKK
jgi:UDP-glucose 4-epimerase